MIPPMDETRLRAAASGTLPNGKAVIVNSDGTVSVVGPTGGDPAAGTPVVFNAGTTSTSPKTAVTFDSSSNKVVIAYTDGGNSLYGTAIVGTVAAGDNSITFGSEVVFESANTDNIGMTFDSNSNKVVIAYRDRGNSNYGTAIVGTVSSTSISFGSPTVFESAHTNHCACGFDSTTNKVVIAFRDAGNSNYGTAIVGTVSSTSISFGSAAVFLSAATGIPSVSYNVAGTKTIIAYPDEGNSDHGTVIAASISGTSISFGTAVVFAAGPTYQASLTYDSTNQKTVLAYQANVSGLKARAVVLSLSGTSITVNTPVVYKDANVSQTTIVYDSSANRVVATYDAGLGSARGNAVVGEVSGTSITFGSSTTFEAGQVNQLNSTFDSNSNRVVFSYSDIGNSDHGTADVFQTSSPNLTAENYIGMSGGGVDYISATKGSAATYESAATNYNAAGYDSNTNRVVFAYKDEGNSNYGTAIVATISGTSISFGTAVVFESATTDHTKVAFDSNLNKIVICYRDSGNSNYGTAIVGTVASGDNSISFGSAAVFNALSTEHIAPVFDTNSNKIVISFGEVNSGTYKARSVVATISGTSISFGGASEFLSGSVSGLKSTFDSNSNKVVVTYISSTTGKARIGTVSGTSISWGTEVEFEDSETRNTTCTFDSLNNKIGVFFYGPSSASFIVGTVSGTDISFGDAVSLSGVPSQFFESIFDTETNLCVAVYSTDPASSAAYVTASISGTTATIGDIVILEVTSSSVGGLTYDSTAKKSVLCYTLPSSGNKYGTAIVFSPEKTDRGEVASGSSASIDVIGTVNDQQTGLTAGQSYYVQTDGTIGLAADSPSVFAGTAISATKLLVKA